MRGKRSAVHAVLGRSGCPLGWIDRIALGLAARRDLLDVLISIDMTADYITGIFISMMFAGHHTSSGTASWALIELMRNPEQMLGVVAELDELAGHPGVGADQLIDHPGRPGGLAQACDLLGRGTVAGGPGLGGQGAAALGESLRVRAVQLGSRLSYEIGTAHPVIVPRARTPHHYRRDPPRAVRSAPVDGAGKE